MQPSRKAVYEYIAEYKKANDGISPVVDEIATACHLHSSTVRYHLMKLEIAGKIQFSNRRGIKLTGGTYTAPTPEN